MVEVPREIDVCIGCMFAFMSVVCLIQFAPYVVAVSVFIICRGSKDNSLQVVELSGH